MFRLLHSSIVCILFTVIFCHEINSDFSNSNHVATKPLSSIYKGVDQNGFSNNLTVTSLRRRKRSGSSKSESDAEIKEKTWALPQYQEIIDMYREPDGDYIRGEAYSSDIARDAQSYTLDNTEMNNPSSPFITITTKTFQKQLDKIIPMVIRAEIRHNNVKAGAVKRDGNGIKKAAPWMVQVLKEGKKQPNFIPYDVGHIVAHQLGGPDNSYNFAPMSVRLNRRVWLKMENHIKKWVNDHEKNKGFVKMLVVIYYDVDDTTDFLPFAYGVNLHYYLNETELAVRCNDIVYYNCVGECKKTPTTKRPTVKTATNLPKVTTLRPKVTTMRPKVTTMRPKLTATRPKVTMTRPKVTATRPKVTTMPPKVTTIRPKVTTMQPKVLTGKRPNVQPATVIPQKKLDLVTTKKPRARA